MIDNTLSQLVHRIYRKGDFLYPSKDSEIIVRMPNNRNIKHISVEEIAEAMMKILEHCIGGTNKEKLCAETTKAYGFNRAGPNIALKMNDAYDMLIMQGRVKMVDEKIVMGETK